MSGPTRSDIAHLQTGTLDTSGFGEGSLRDVALVYRTETGDTSTTEAKAPAAQDTPAVEQPLFTVDGEPTAQALPVTQPQIGQQMIDAATGAVLVWNGTGWAEDVEEEIGTGKTPAATQAPAEAKAPVEPEASADKEGKAAPAAKITTRRGRAG